LNFKTKHDFPHQGSFPATPGCDQIDVLTLVEEISQSADFVHTIVKVVPRYWIAVVCFHKRKKALINQFVNELIQKRINLFESIKNITEGIFYRPTIPP